MGELTMAEAVEEEEADARTKAKAIAAPAPTLRQCCLASLQIGGGGGSKLGIMVMMVRLLAETAD